MPPYASFLKALVHRYGPHGTFWQADPAPRSADPDVADLERAEHPELLAGKPFARSYVKLLEAAHDAIKSADPGARVVLAGLPNYSWLVPQIDLRIPGARGMFDVVAVHPYTTTPRRGHDPELSPCCHERCR